MRSASDYNKGWADAEVDAANDMLLSEYELLADGYSYDFTMGYTDYSSTVKAGV